MAKVHLIGIGGVGMSALAVALLKLGAEVSGSDRAQDTPNVRMLERLGIRTFPDDGSGIGADTDEVIVSTAIESGNPGLAKAAALGIPVIHRAQALARALAGYRLVAVAGTCGKSTVTAMLGHVLSECGFDPMCVNGANVPGWDGAVRFGRGEYAVAEVDESDRSLVAFRPYAAIVTNASADHYSKEEMDEVFDNFVRDCPGPVIDGRKLDLSAEEARWTTPLPGRHNLQNAALAARMALALGCAEADVRRALACFRGVERRLQLVSAAGAAPAVYDDYAHNPEKLHAMWTTLAEKHPEGICVVWRPHGYGPLRKMLDPLARMFASALRKQDALLLLPVYDAGGTADRSVASEDLLAKFDAGLRARIEVVPDLDAAHRRCAAVRGEFAAFAVCGARDPGLPELARRIAGANP